jgi:hypothetical protein
VLEQAERWIASRPPGAPAPTEEIQAFIRRSRQATTQRRNILTGSLAAGLLLAVILAGVAIWQALQALEQKRVAEQQTALADTERIIAEKNEQLAREERDRVLISQSRLLANTAQQQAGTGDAVSGMLLAIEALPDPDSALATRPYVPEAELALFSTLATQYEKLVLDGFHPILTPDGPYLLTRGNTLKVWQINKPGEALLINVPGERMQVIGQLSRILFSKS